MKDKSKTKEQLINEPDKPNRQNAIKESNEEISESLYKHIWDTYAQSPIPTLVLSKKGKIVDYNSAMARLTGYSHKEVPDIDAWMPKLYPDEEYRNKVIEISRRSRQREINVKKDEFTITRKDGEKRTIQFSVYEILYEGKPSDLQVVQGEDISERIHIREELKKYQYHLEEILKERTTELTKTIKKLETGITERERVEEALKESEEKYRGLVDNSLIGVYETTLEGILLYVNKALATIFEFRTAQDMISESALLRYKNLKDREKIIDLLKKSGEIKNYELEVVTKTGKNKVILLNASLRGVVFSGMVIDITKRKKAEEELEHIFSLSPDMVAVCTTEGEFLKVNPTWEKVLGYSQKELLDLGWSKLVHPDDMEKTNKEVEKQLKGISVVNFVNRYKCKDGSYKIFEWQATFANKGIVHATARDITERKQAEDALQESKERLRGFMDSATEGFTLMDAEFNVLDLNDVALKQMYLTKKEDIVGKNMATVFPYFTKTERYAAYKKVMRTGKPYSSENIAPHPGYSYQEKHFSAKAFKVGNGFGIITTDITERKQAEDELRESEKRFRQFFENLPEYCYMVSLEGMILDVNKAALDALGYRKKNLVGKPLSTIYASECLPKMKANLLKWKRTGKLKDVEMTIITKQGERHYVLLNADAVRSPSGEILYSVSVQRDITERKQAEEEARKFKTISERAGYGVAIVSLKGNLLYLNESFAAILGYTTKELVGRNLSVFHNKEQMESVERLKTQLIKTGSYIAEEVWHKRKDNSVFPSLMNGTLIKDEKGKPLFMAATAIDITERKQREEEIRKSREELRNLTTHLQTVREEERRSLARQIHDGIGQELAALQMDLYMIRKRLPENQKPLEDAAEKMKELLRNTIQKLRSLYEELRPSILDDFGIAEAMDVYGKEFQKRSGILFDWETNIEEIVLDEDKNIVLFRVFQEALTNVERHAEATYAKVCFNKRNEKLELQVKDNGKGINDEDLYSHGSYGIIGLRERVKFLNGDLKIKGIPDKGTTVKIVIPLQKEDV